MVLDGMATLQEIETHWSIIDLAEANEVLDYRDAVQKHQAEQMKRGK